MYACVCMCCGVQLERLNELEDLVADQENTIAALQEKLRQKEMDISNLKTRLEQADRHLKLEHDRLSGLTPCM